METEILEVEKITAGTYVLISKKRFLIEYVCTNKINPEIIELTSTTNETFKIPNGVFITKVIKG